MTMLDIDHPEQRVISFNGVSNFRDIGGYRGAENGTVKWGQVYRSAHLCQLDEQDVVKLEELGIRCSIDLRGQLESERNAYAYDFLQRQECAIEPEVARLVNESVSKNGAITVNEAHEFMHQMYQSFSSTYVGQFSRFFKHVIQAPTPIVVHCTAGKDRTGFACAMLLSALGVQRDDILDDYLLTQQHYNVQLESRKGVDLAAMKVLWGVSVEYLASTLDDITREFGGVAPFLEKALGIDDAHIATLRHKLLA